MFFEIALFKSRLLLLVTLLLVVLLLVEVKPKKKNLGTQIGSETRVFCHFLKVASLVFLDIVQDCNLGQCLTYSRGETSKKKL